MFRRWLLVFLFLACSTVASARKLPALIPYEDNGLWGYCDAEGHVVITPQWEKANFFNNGKALVFYPTTGRDKIFCTVDTKGSYIIPPERHWNGEWNGLESTPPKRT